MKKLLHNKNLLTGLFIFAVFFLVGINNSFAESTGWSTTNLLWFGLPSQSISGIIRNLLMWLLYMLGIVGVIGFVLSGIMYIGSIGEEDGIKRAKRAMTWSIVGVVVGLAGVVVIQAVDWALRGYSGI